MVRKFKIRLMRVATGSLGLIVAFLSPAFSQDLTPPVNAIIDSLTSQFNKVEDYTATVRIWVDMPRFRMPKKTVKLYFKQADMVKVEADGFAVVPRTGLAMSPVKIFSDLLDLKVAGHFMVDGHPYWIVEGTVNPDSISGHMWGEDRESGIEIRSQMWVDANRWVITRTETYLDTVRVLSLVTSYEETEDGFLLPRETELRFQLGGRLLPRMGNPDPMSGPFGEHQRSADLGEESSFEGIVRIEFSRYKVNRGLKDRLFDKTTF